MKKLTILVMLIIIGLMQTVILPVNKIFAEEKGIEKHPNWKPLE